MCRSRRELSNAYLLAKFGFDTAENEPPKVLPLEHPASGAGCSGWQRPAHLAGCSARKLQFAQLSQEVLQGFAPFSAGSGSVDWTKHREILTAVGSSRIVAEMSKATSFSVPLEKKNCEV